MFTPAVLIATNTTHHTLHVPILARRVYFEANLWGSHTTAEANHLLLGALSAMPLSCSRNHLDSTANIVKGDLHTHIQFE
jgi:hypothetical protein